MLVVNVSIVETDGGPALVAWRDEGEGAGMYVVRGLVADPALLTPAFRAAEAAGPLLPPTLTTRVGSGALLVTSARDSSGRRFDGSSTSQSRYTSDAPLDPRLGGLAVAASLSPDAADALLIGGLPKSRLPWVLGLIGFASLLVGVAVVQLRREADLARLRSDFVSGVSHELRTPLAQIRMFAETVSLGRVRTQEESARSIQIILQEAQRLSQVMLARDGREGLSLVETNRPDLVVLDLMLPGVDGYRLLRQLRDEGLTTPVLILTAKGEEADKVRGFRCGADDYVTKPFGVLELLARIEALLRRSKPRDPPILRFGDVEVSVERRTVARRGQPIALTPMEFDLLAALLRRRGTLATRVELLRRLLCVPGQQPGSRPQAHRHDGCGHDRSGVCVSHANTVATRARREVMLAWAICKTCGQNCQQLVDSRTEAIRGSPLFVPWLSSLKAAVVYGWPIRRVRLSRPKSRNYNGCESYRCLKRSPPSTSDNESATC